VYAEFGEEVPIPDLKSICRVLGLADSSGATGHALDDVIETRTIRMDQAREVRWLAGFAAEATS
jgi:hypothetical protein